MLRPQNVGKVCIRRMILAHVWGHGYERESHYLKGYAHRIRRELGDDRGRFLQSDPSVGYRLVPPADRGQNGDGIPKALSPHQ
ncbi:MAG TPA: winged helix-turn-helix domain-containing protein [Streptosporangiaceae bacterium]|nr:winged helix-turn-helix domain-containing protein [Streptosporangiaceae bacterium]